MYVKVTRHYLGEEIVEFDIDDALFPADWENVHEWNELNAYLEVNCNASIVLSDSYVTPTEVVDVEISE